MLQTVEAEVSVDGSVRLLEPLHLDKPSRALVTLLDVVNGTNEVEQPIRQGGKRELDKRVPPIIPPHIDFNLSVKWLAEHRQEYAGQWVALDQDRLIAHGFEAKAVYAAADASGVEYPLVTQLEPADALPYAGF